MAALNYLAPMTERPRNYTYDPPPGVPRSNSVAETHVVPILSARPVAAEISLDREGFALLRHQSAVRDFYDDDEVRRDLLRGSRARAGRSDRCETRVHLRPHGAPPGARRGRSRAGHAAAAGDARARRPYREVGPAAGARLARRRGGGIAARPRAGDQSVAADPRAVARCAARGVRCACRWRRATWCRRTWCIATGSARPMA